LKEWPKGLEVRVGKVQANKMY